VPAASEKSSTEPSSKNLYPKCIRTRVDTSFLVLFVFVLVPVSLCTVYTASTNGRILPSVPCPPMDTNVRDAFGFDSLDSIQLMIHSFIHFFIQDQNQKSLFITEFSLDTT
jgi:hypothetical protein